MVVFSDALHRAAVLLCRRSLSHHNSHLFTSLLSGFHRLDSTATSSWINPFSSNFISSPHTINPSQLYTTSCSSLETQPRESTPNDVSDSPRDSTNLFRAWGCTDDDISKLFTRRPSLKRMDTKLLQSKLAILSDLGITSSDLVKIINCRPRFLISRINRSLNERLEYFHELFGSKALLIKAIVRNPSLLTYDFHNKIKPTLKMYEEMGITRQDLTMMLLSRPTLIPRSTLDDEKIEYIRKTGVSKESKMYKHVVTLFAISRLGTIREKVMNLEKYGLTEDEVLTLFGRSPLLLTLSTDKVQRNMTYIVGTMKLDASVVLNHPILIFFNLEAVLKPRFLLAEKIEDMGLEPRMKGDEMMRALRMSENRLLLVFVMCHPKEVADELSEFYRNAKCVRRLAESSKKNFRLGFPF